MAEVKLVAEDRRRLRQIDEQDAQDVRQQEGRNRAEDIWRRWERNNEAFVFISALAWRLAASLFPRLHLF